MNETPIEHEKLGVLLHNIFLVKIHKSVCDCDGERSAQSNTKLLVKNVRTELIRTINSYCRVQVWRAELIVEFREP